MKNPDSIINCLPAVIRTKASELIKPNADRLNELRLRVGNPAVVMYSQGYEYIDSHVILSSEDIQEAFERICDYSVYSHQQELSHGFITLPGGHRAGICGTASHDKLGNRTVNFISSINIRVSNEHIGCSAEIFSRLFSKRIAGTLIAGPPCSGKTTLIKDIGLKLSSSPISKKVCIVDERNEIAAMYRGVPQNTIGPFCDVLSFYPKAEGMINAVKTLSPEIIICDEIGGHGEAEAVCEVLNSGIVIISTVHSCNVNELYNNYSVKKLLKSGAFANVVLLRGGSFRCVIDEIIEVV